MVRAFLRPNVRGEYYVRDSTKSSARLEFFALKAPAKANEIALPAFADRPLFSQHLYRALALVLRRISVSCGFCVQVWLCPFPLGGPAQTLNPLQLWDQVSANVALIYVATHASR